MIIGRISKSPAPRLLATSVAWLLVAGHACGAPAAEWELRDGDRVVLIGNTFIERDQTHGYLETLLSARYPDRTFVFRNLGWSGDTVFADARAGFGTPADGLRQLKEHVESLKPTVIVLGYGSNEAFDAQPGLSRFLDGLDVLLNLLSQTEARVVILSPLRQEKLAPPLPPPERRNADLLLYRDALNRVAGERGHRFVDLYDQPVSDPNPGTQQQPLTDNGIHLTAYGYWRTSAVIEAGLGLSQQVRRWRVELASNGTVTGSQGTQVSNVERTPIGIKFQALDAVLPFPLPPAGAPRDAARQVIDRTLAVSGLSAGRHSLSVDGQPVASASDREWAAGVQLTRGPEFDQVEALRRLIVQKNLLYFFRWRPQNETYLLGFRKHEQGQNAVEIAQFEPLVADKEAAIAELRRPLAHRYELARE